MVAYSDLGLGNRVYVDGSDTKLARLLGDQILPRSC